MTRKAAHFTTHTAEEIDLSFKAAVESLVMRVSELKAKLHEIPIDGVRSGVRKGELRKPDTSYYGQTFVEARSAAGLMVDLGLAPLVLDVRRREPPFPDVEVCLQDGNSIFIEQTIVMDPDAHRLSIVIEETNISVTQAAATDGALRDILDVGLFTIRLDHKTERHLTLTLPVRALSAEVCSVGRQLEGDVPWRRPKPKDYPLLAELSAHIFYRPVIRTGAVIQPPMDHGRLPVLPPTLREWLRSKLGKAGTYAAECRPL